MKFKYKAKTASGSEQEGKIEAASKEMAIEILQKHKLVVVYIEPIKKMFSFDKLSSILHRVKSKKIVMFSKEVSIMLTSGISLLEALKIEYQQEENLYFKEQLFIIMSKVDDGILFSSALADCPEIFSDFFINVVRAGETSGNLQDSFAHLADYLEKQNYLFSKVKNAMMYPAFVIAGFLVIGLGMMYFVLPNLLSMFEGADMELPIATKVLMFGADFVQNYIFFIVLFLVGGAIFFKKYIKTKSGKKNFDRAMLKLPGFNKILKKVYVARFAGNFSMLIESGIPIITALQISGDIVGNDVYKEIIYNSVEEVRAGGSIAYSFERSDQVPVVVSKMMKIGEKTGKLDVILKDISIFYTKEVDIAIEGIMTIIEPILIFALGAGVMILVSGILMPIYQMTETM